MGVDFRLKLHALAALFWINLKHYLLAVWGVGLRLDPDYPAEGRIFGSLIVDSVLEYRLYGLFAPWCVFLAFVMPSYLLPALPPVWAFLAALRAHHYKTNFRFWTQAYQEAPHKMRNKIRYVEQLSIEIERRYKKPGVRWNDREIQELAMIARHIQDSIVERRK